jgi:uncharacterized protein YndB with AHSA1/START domain
MKNRTTSWVLRILLGLIGILVVAVGVLALMGTRRDAGVSRASVEIQAPREQVWSWIVEPQKFKRWVGWVVDVETINPVMGVGHRDVVIMNEPGSPEPVRLETSWTEYAPPDRFAADVAFPGLFTGSQSYQLTALGQNRTRLEITTRIHYTSALVRLFEPLATPSSTRKIESDLATLKPLAEGDAKQSAASLTGPPER